jgi:hypothetical protein
MLSGAILCIIKSFFGLPWQGFYLFLLVESLPDGTLQTGPTEIEEIQIPLPNNNDPVHLKLAIGAGELSINPGAADALVQGKITYNVKDFKPQVVT